MCGEDEDREREREIKGERENEGGGGEEKVGGGGHGWEENFPLILIIQKRRNSCFMNVWRKV